MRLIISTLALILATIALHAQRANYIKLDKQEDLGDYLDQLTDETEIVSAHRGGRYYPGLPENSLQVLKYTVSQTPAILEVDVSMSADSILFLLHDNSLDRTTTCKGDASEMVWKAIKNCRLVDDYGEPTKYKIPKFRKVLKWAKGKAILSIDVKRGVPFQLIAAEIEKYGMEDYAFVITYSRNATAAMHQINPEIMISADLPNENQLNKLLELGVNPDRLVAFTGTGSLKPDFFQKLDEMDIPVIFGTMRHFDPKLDEEGIDIYYEVIDSGVDIIATDKPVEAARAIRAHKQ